MRGLEVKHIDKGKGIIQEIINCPNSDYVGGKKERINHVDSVIDSFPPGYRFCPTDQELVVEYLREKVGRKRLPLNRIMDVDLYSCSPRQLSEMYELKREEEWYFFTSRNKKYPKGKRPNRATGNGFWKASGADSQVSNGGSIVGYKKALVYYEGPARCGVKTDWKMQEYRLANHDTPSTSRGQPGDMKLDDCVLCKIYKTRKAKANPENNDEDQEDEEMQVPTPNEEWPNTECLDKNQQCSHKGVEEMLPNAENPRDIQQYCYAQGMQTATQNEELLQNAKNPGNIQQYQDYQGTEVAVAEEEFPNAGDPQPHHNMSHHESPRLLPFPDTLDYYNCYDQDNPRSYDVCFNGSVDYMQPLDYLLAPVQFDSFDYDLFP
ncbi:transcription factor JUNGBRUNNEN 1-like [Rhododendron vialii]|uniref:transcription factor JUNGBRUNNEN 1-like n=1 Tax=Rhododendron vialii TaxID=182163 RepID=UPI00265D675B|nr:transcription factor JUNGBRUNNEN 1-like [Rhododendron vialii]